MEDKHRKVQVVLAARAPSGSWSYLIFKTNKERGHFWQNVTGTVEAGETYEEAALREAQEESGLRLEDIVELQALPLVEHFTDRRKKKVEEHAFLLVLEAQWKPTLDPHEHENWKWIESSELKADVVEWPGNYQALVKSDQLLRRVGV